MFQIDFSKQFKKLLKESYELEMVSGYSIETLIQLFAAGCTLKPAKPPVSLVDALKDVDVAPTIDAEPVKHGRWIEKQQAISYCEDDVDVFYKCSVCGCQCCGEPPYCPNCGAKMDGEA